MTSSSAPIYTHSTILTGPNPNIVLHSSTHPLILRTLVFTDGPAILSILSDTRNIQHDKSAAGIDTLPDAQRLVDSWSVLTTPLERANFLVLVNDQPAGLSGLGHIDSVAKIGNAGVMLNTDVRGKGYAYEVLRLTVDHAFGELGMEEVQFGCTEENVEMRGLAERKFGLVATKTVGRWGDEFQYSIKKDDWIF